jgi:hypothetical protein
MDSDAPGQTAKHLKPTDRPALAAQGLATVARRSVSSLPAPAPAPARRWVWAVGVGAALVLGLGAGLLFRGERAAAPLPVNSAISAPPVLAVAPPTAVPQPPSPVPSAAVSAAAVSAPRGAPTKVATHALVSPVHVAPAARSPGNGKRYDFGF